MLGKYTSEKLLRELPRPMIHFLWYLWDTYRGLGCSAFRITLQDTGETHGQRFIIRSNGESITRDFGCRVDADIAIRMEGTRYFMEYY